MDFISMFLIHRKNYIIIIFTAIIVLYIAISFYETQRRNMIRVNNELIYIHHNEVYMLNHAISIKDTDIAEMTDQNNILHTKLTYANSNHQTLEYEFETLQQQFEDLRRRYHWEMGTSDGLMWDLGLREIDAPLITHATTDPDKIDMIIRHFNAMYSGDLDAYLATIQGGDTWEYPGINPDSDDWWGEDWTWTDWLLQTFHRIAAREYYRMEVKFIPDWWYHNLDPEWGRQTSGHLFVWVLVQETPDSEPFLRAYPLGITSRGGANWNEWRIYDYH